MKSPNDQSAAAADLRLQAETIAREDAVRLPEDLEAMSPEAVRQALHELRVHQIELEMQNEELRRRQQELAEARARYFDLYDLAPVGYCTIGENGLIQEGNLTIATLLGVTRHDLDKALISRFIVKEDQDVYYHCFKQLFRTAAPQECELRMVKKDGTAFWAHLAATAAQDAYGCAVCRMALSDITGRKREEAELQTSEERHHAIFEKNQSVQILVDPQGGQIIDANPAASRFYGYSLEQLRRMKITDINTMAPDEVQREMAAVRSGQKQEFNFQHRLANGQIRDVEVHSSSIPVNGGEQLHFIIHDITRRRRYEMIQEARLRLMDFAHAHTLNELLRAILDEVEAISDSRIGFFHFLQADQQTLSLQAWSTNTVQSMCRAEGASRHYPVAQAGVWVECIHQRRAVIHNDYTALPNRKGLPPGHAPIQRQLVVPVFREGLVVAILGVGNKPVDYTEDDLRDVSMLADFAWDSAARKQADDLLHESERRLASIIEATNVGTWEWNVKTGETVFNQRWAQMIGYTLDELAPVSINTWYAHLHPDDLKQFSERRNLHFTADLPEYDCECRIRHKDGHWVWIHDRGRVIARTSDGQPLLMYGTHTDITGRKQAEAELRMHREHLEVLVQERTAELVESRDQAQVANRAKSVFLANMSHELRTPLTAILGFSELMARDPANPRQTMNKLGIVLRSGEHLLALINDILEISQIEAGQFEIKCRDADLGEMVRDVISMMSDRAKAKGLSLVLDQSSDFPHSVNTDPVKFRQILANLVGNAIKFTDAGQITIRLLAKTTPAGQVLTVEVHDTGIGISQGDMDRVFHPFEQVGTRMPEGAGLGLAISRQYVQMLSGNISVDSKPGKGSCFRFTIPVGNPAASAGSIQMPSPPSLSGGIGSPVADIRILIVEDQPNNRQLLHCIVDPLHLQVRDAVNGQEAVAIFQEWRPQIILMDWRMPVMDGLEATRQIRVLPGGTETVIIAVSAYVFKEDQQKMLEAGCNDFLTKPFGADALLTLLKKHLHLDLVNADEKTPALPAFAPADGR